MHFCACCRTCNASSGSKNALTCTSYAETCSFDLAPPLSHFPGWPSRDCPVSFPSELPTELCRVINNGHSPNEFNGHGFPHWCRSAPSAKTALPAIPRKSGVRSDMGPRGMRHAKGHELAELVSLLVTLSADIRNALDMSWIALGVARRRQFRHLIRRTAAAHICAGYLRCHHRWHWAATDVTSEATAVCVDRRSFMVGLVRCAVPYKRNLILEICLSLHLHVWSSAWWRPSLE